MSSVVISGDTSGAITLAAPSIAGTNTITLPAVTGTAVVAGQNSAITASTAQASTSGTSIDFTGIPSWVKRVTVMLRGVSSNGTSDYLLQVGSGSVTTSGYLGVVTRFNGATPATGNLTSGYLINGSSGTVASAVYDAVLDVILVSTNNYLIRGIMGAETNVYSALGCCQIPLSGALDRVRITTVNGTDTFDAGSINILYE